MNFGCAKHEFRKNISILMSYGITMNIELNNLSVAVPNSNDRNSKFNIQHFTDFREEPKIYYCDPITLGESRLTSTVIGNPHFAFLGVSCLDVGNLVQNLVQNLNPFRVCFWTSFWTKLFQSSHGTAMKIHQKNKVLSTA